MGQGFVKDFRKYIPSLVTKSATFGGFFMSNQKIDLSLSQIISGAYRHIINGFLIDRQSQGLSKNTIRIYTHE